MTERAKPYTLRNRVWPSLLELSSANFERRPWSHTCSLRSFAHMLLSSTVFFASSHSSTFVSCLHWSAEEEGPTNAFFRVPLVVCEISARSASIGGVAANHSSLSDHLNCLATPCASMSRAFVYVNPSCFQGRLACPLPAWGIRHFYRTRASCRNTPSQAVWLP